MSAGQAANRWPEHRIQAERASSPATQSFWSASRSDDAWVHCTECPPGQKSARDMQSASKPGTACKHICLIVSFLKSDRMPSFCTYCKACFHIHFVQHIPDRRAQSAPAGKSHKRLCISDLHVQRLWKLRQEICLLRHDSATVEKMRDVILARFQDIMTCLTHWSKWPHCEPVISNRRPHSLVTLHQQQVQNK